MHLAPQKVRTFFVSSVTDGRRALLQSERMARLLIDVMGENRQNQRFSIHEFVIMPNHPSANYSGCGSVIGKSNTVHQRWLFISVKTELDLNFTIWEKSFTNHRVHDLSDYNRHRDYIHQNPVKAKLAEKPELFPYSSAYPGMDVDAVPPWLKPRK